MKHVTASFAWKVSVKDALMIVGAPKASSVTKVVPASKIPDACQTMIVILKSVVAETCVFHAPNASWTTIAAGQGNSVSVASAFWPLSARKTRIAAKDLNVLVEIASSSCAAALKIVRTASFATVANVSTHQLRPLVSWQPQAA
jgi:hypothetical protein